TMCGLTAWIEASGLSKDEEVMREKYQNIVLSCIDAATDPDSKDYMNFDDGTQPLVDTAFFAHSLVRSQKNIVGNLDERVHKNVVDVLKKSRKITPWSCNWILFSAMVETALYVLGEKDYDMTRVKYALRQFMQWYKGDGIYGDGDTLHVDYYNSFVIVPMLVDISITLAPLDDEIRDMGQSILKRAKRQAALLERFISPEGTYPIIGRSITYRFGAFQLLAQASLEHFLDKAINPAQVRCALTAVIKRVMEAPGMFDENGFLRHGIYGYQPGLSEEYICTGSLYLCSTVFIALGISPKDAFWNGENALWTAQKVANGDDFMLDHCITD
ncbi:MAG: DUF2264 domain-containing protein, partial [Oscillospiraceae bacterium]